MSASKKRLDIGGGSWFVNTMGLSMENLRAGDAGTWQTVQVIKRFIADGRSDPQIRQLAIGIVRRQARVGDARAEIAALFNYVRSELRYVADPVDTEFVASARRVIELGGGDCDDLVVLLGSLLESVGYETRVKVMAVDPAGDYEHIYLEVNTSAGWLALDPSARAGTVGWEFPLRGREHTFSIQRPLLGAVSYDFAAVDAWLRVYPVDVLKRAAVRGLNLSQWRYDPRELAELRDWLAHDAAFEISRPQRDFLRELLEQTQRAQGAGGLALNLRIGHWLGNVWEGIKDVAHAVASVGRVVGPFLAVIPGVGQVAAALVTVGSETLYELTDPKTGNVVGYLPGDTAIDAQGNFVLDNETLSRLRTTETGDGLSSWWVWLAIGGFAAVLLLPGRRR